MPITSAVAASPTEEAGTAPYRVMVVDDSAVTRGIISSTLDADPNIQVISTVNNGQAALDMLPRKPIEVVVLDIEMPVMDGLTALPKLLELDPGLQVVMASTLTVRNAKVSLEALSKGAADYVAKPTSSRELISSSNFQRDLVGKVKALGEARRRAFGETGGDTGGDARGGEVSQGATALKRMKKVPLYNKPVVLRRASRVKPEILAIGSSTGGPNALVTVLPALKLSKNLPILITQHMPPTFTTILSRHINDVAGVPCAEAEDGEPLLGGRIYLARGDYHMRVAEENGRRVIRIDQGPQENYCRPAVDPMLRSVAAVYGPRSLVAILTGMGRDGAAGCEAVIEAGGTAIAQDEKSSIVWGMPGAVATAGLCSSVVPLDDVARTIMRHLAGPPS